jgi:small GTP-binding protein
MPSAHSDKKIRLIFSELGAQARKIIIGSTERLLLEPAIIMPARDFVFKILLVGDGAVGKTALAQRYLTGLFPENLRVTIGANFFTKRIIVGDLQIVLQIWDLGGEERFRFMMGNYCRGAHAALFLYDITNPSTLYHLDQWVEELRKNAPSARLIVIGAKADLATSRKVQLAEATEYARERGASFTLEVSSKTGENVNLAFEMAAKYLLADQK